ncbi:pyrroloquinoline quinone biosynthesis protein A [Pseudomonas nitroreducens]|nr:pyrroloquinoline quinone biosynthesis protein A [Pseudomonas nitroreducens]MCP1690115.1 pyrroloquinoline quinone biosynthesis protein A [Pseudomonas nitroreducens]
MFNSTLPVLPVPSNKKEDRPMWTKPSFTDLRLGFEVTLYFANR